MALLMKFLISLSSFTLSYPFYIDPTLKLLIVGDRVSFGSTKGSMVETLIYESPQHSDEGTTSSTQSGWNKNNVSAKSKNLRSVIGSVSESLPEETVALLR